MWLVFAILSMLAYAATDLLGKRKVDAGTALAPLELLVSYGTLAFVTGLAFFAFGLGESGRAPWTIIAEEPLVLAAILCFVSFWFLCLLSFRHIGLSVETALGGTDGIVFFLGMLAIHFIFGKMGAAREMLHPARLVPILVVLTGVFLLPRMEETPSARHRTIIGMLLLLLAIVFDGGDTLIMAVIFDEGRVGPVDCMIASWFVVPLLLAVLTLVFRLKDGRWTVPFRGGAGTIVYAAFAVLSAVGYLFASSHDAVRTGLVFVAAPVFTLIGARIFLKERYSLRQNLCIWAVALAAIAFCIIDGKLH